MEMRPVLVFGIQENSDTEMKFCFLEVFLIIIVSFYHSFLCEIPTRSELSDIWSDIICTFGFQ